ncbi:MAG: hypothetical protein IJU39_03215, partial [Clostridia bacterium]|nr:hypothetical protein [Clostridia bacterium]
ENCNMWSWQSCGLGCGTVENGHIIVKDCDIRSFVPGTKTDEGKVNGTDEEKEAHAKYVHGTRGAITYHTKSGVDRSSNESFTLINTSVYLKGGTKVVNIKNGSSQDFKLLTFINNTFHNDIESCNVIAIPKSLYLCALSSGNNIGTVNSDGSGYSLMIK